MGGGKCGGQGGGRGIGGSSSMGVGSRWFTGTEDVEVPSPDESQIKALSEKEEIESLKQTAQDLRRQLEAIEGRLGDLAGNKI